MPPRKPSYPEKSHRGPGWKPRPPVAQSGGVATSPYGQYPKQGCASSAPPPKRRNLTALTPQGLKVVGVLEDRDGRLVLVKRVDRQRHLLRLPEPAWAVDAEGLRQAQELGANRVEVRDAARGDTWYSPLDYLLSRGQRFDRGWGQQVALPLHHWSFLPARRGKSARQPSLFV